MDEEFIDDAATVSGLQKEISRLQLEIQQVYSGELFNARVQIAYLENDVKELTEENERLKNELSRLRGNCQASLEDSEEFDDDWYTSHGHGD